MSLLSLLALLLSVRIAISDLYARRVPNRWLALTSAAAVLGLLVSVLRDGDTSVAPHLLGAVLGLAALLPFHLLGWMGAGDVKFFSVLGLLLGWQALLPLWIIASLLAGLHVLCVITLPRLAAALPPRVHLLQLRTAHRWQAREDVRQMQRARQGRVGIPFAAYLAFATVAMMLAPVWGAGA